MQTENSHENIDSTDEGNNPTDKPQKKGCRYSFLFLFLACSGLLLLIVGGVLFSKLSPEVTNDAEEVEKIKNEITPLIIPDVFSKHAALKTDNFAYSINLIIYERDKGNSKLILVDFKVKLFDDKDQEYELLNNVLSQMSLIPLEQESFNWEPEKIIIDGKPVEYEFVKGVNLTTGDANYMIRGPIPHLENNEKTDSGPELIYITTTEEDVKNGVKLIQELKTKKEL